MSLVRDLQRYEMEHGTDEPFGHRQQKAGVCSYCGEYVETGERGFRGRTIRSGSDRFEAVLLHKECLFDYVVSRYDETELATVLGLKEVL